MKKQMLVYDEIELYDNYNTFLLVPRKHQPKSRTEVLPTVTDWNNIVKIDRRTHEITKLQVNEDESYDLFKNMKTMTRILGIIGVVELIAGPYLIVVLKREFAGYIKHHKIYRVKQIQLIPFSFLKFYRLSQQEKGREISYIEMLHRFFVVDKSFYFSYTTDITKNAQQMRNAIDSRTIWKKADEMFFWNKNISKRLMEAELDGFILPMIRGLVEFYSIKINKKKVIYGLISRIGWKRSGTRFNCRGADENGNVANFVETEQIVQHDGQLASFVQVRGSIPLLWTQYANLKYTPEIRFSERDPKKHRQAFFLHFSYLLRKYGNVNVINLTKKRGHEQRLCDTFEEFIQKVPMNPPLKYFYFDFHGECKKLNFDAVNKLLLRVDDEIQKMGYYKEIFNSKSNYEFPTTPNSPGGLEEMRTRQMGLLSTTINDSETISGYKEESLLDLPKSELTLEDLLNDNEKIKEQKLLDLPNMENPNLQPVMQPMNRPKEETLLDIEGGDIPRNYSHIDLENVPNDPFNVPIKQEIKSEQILDDPFHVPLPKKETKEEPKKDNPFGIPFPEKDIPSFTKLKILTKEENLRKSISKKTDSTTTHMQTSIFRTNCIDCCDRTNVVQTYLAKTILEKQFRDIGIFHNNEYIDNHKQFKGIFQHGIKFIDELIPYIVWANNGDLISRLYAGTHALMGDYTRTGQRSVSGLLTDGYNSAMRYVQNNFRDTSKQRMIALSLGQLDVHSKAEIEIYQKSEIINDLFLL